MKDNLKLTVQAELMQRLHNNLILADANVECDSGKGNYLLDVALHTGHFIYGNITVCEQRVPVEVMHKFGIEQFNCKSFEDIDACVEWAKQMQSKHMVSQTVSMVA